MTSRKIRNAPPRAPGKRVSREEAEVQYKYGSLRITRDGRVRLHARTVPGLPDLDFAAHHGLALADGAYVWDRANYSIVANHPGRATFFMIFVSRGRVASTCFNFGLAPDEMREAVNLLRKAGGGLERWIVPGLEHTRDEIVRMPSSDERGSKMLEVIQELLKATRDLPVAEPWKRLLRERERWIKQQARSTSKLHSPRDRRRTSRRPQR